jgi:hypothetical protein
MTGYAKLAQEASAAEAAKGLDLIEQREKEKPLHVFFKGVRIHLGNEVNKANPELYKQGLLRGEAVRGIVYDGQITDTLVYLTFGNSRRCDVELDLSRSEIRAILTGDIHSSSRGAPKVLAFRLRNEGQAMTARAADSTKEGDNMGAERIAETIVSAMIRGQFD